MPERKHAEQNPALQQEGTSESEQATITKPLPREIGGYEGRPEPTRYGDWEKKGRCIDF